MVFTQCSIINPDSPDVEENRKERHVGKEHPFWEFSTDRHYLDLSTDLKTVSCHLLSWLTLSNKLKTPNFASQPS